MKKYYLALSVLILCIGAVASTRFLIDNTDPTITVNSTPTIGCKVSFNDLMSNATASDNKEIKSFFVEENALSEIADKKYLTYVAVDTSNNVSKKRVTVNVDSDVTTYHIDVLQPLKAQIKEVFKTKGYLALKNKCGWEVDDTFVIENVDFNLKDTYDAKIMAKKHSHVEPVYTTVDVDNFKAPIITLSHDTYKDFTEMIYNDEYFKEFIVSVEDDVDNGNELMDKVTTNWREVIMPYSSGYVERAGIFTITYKVTDSEGNTGTNTLRLWLETPVHVPVAPAEGE